MKLKKILIVPIVIIILVLSYVFVFSKMETCGQIERATGVRVSFFDIKKAKDTHGGFLGDGEFIVVADCRGKEIDFGNIEGWKKLPLTENLQQMMYGGTDDAGYEFCLAGKNGIPEIEKGYYCFINRHSNAAGKYSDENLFDVYSFNFTLALYDSDTGMLYFYELDT